MKALGLKFEPRRLSVFLTIFLLFIRQSCNAEVDRKVCLGTNNKLTKLGTTEEHYKLLKEMYSGCEIVLGNLEITYLESYHDASFLKEIQEVAGYVLIAFNSVKAIPLINLRVIRGNNLYKDSALHITFNFNESNNTLGLEELPMRQLKEILQGEVTITRNPRLCNLDTIKWKDIVHSGNDIDVKQSSPSHCPTCAEDCKGSCWGSGSANCQTLTKLICAQQCPGRCRGPSPSDCCHSQCAAGCTGPRETDCLACLKFRDGDTCLESCSWTNTYNLRTNLVEVGYKKYACGSTCVNKCPYNYMVTDFGTCVQKCSENSYMVPEHGVLRCIECDGPCPKGKICNGIGYGNLEGVLSINASNIDDFENCTIVLGSIVIMKFSIFGDRYTNTSAMDPAKLKKLKSIREITDVKNATNERPASGKSMLLKTN
ncbi:epidermal growth factor receptor-like [Leptodactylus fuscus]|uniref:epidermal growth factor receptor-like n=1 Tax=Leptodactylus fuscus TaxID=238119 RepID=UPI003F4EF9E6